jgi:hypothetical protein
MYQDWNFDSSIFYPVGTHYTDYAIMALDVTMTVLNNDEDW